MGLAVGSGCSVWLKYLIALMGSSIGFQTAEVGPKGDKEVHMRHTINPGNTPSCVPDLTCTSSQLSQACASASSSIKGVEALVGKSADEGGA